MEKIEHKAFRLYPNGYTGDSLGSLNELLSKGWMVKHIIPENQTTDKHGCNVLILEREIKPN